MPAIAVRLPIATLLAVWACAVAPAPASAQRVGEEDKGHEHGQGEPQDDYVKLFDPGRDDPQDLPETEPPELLLDAAAADPAAQGPAPLRPWDVEPRRTPDRLLGPGDPRDPRSIELFYYGCADDLHRRDVTLFANGTLRLRRGPRGGQEMQLEEIGPIELRRQVDRLLKVRASRDFPTDLQLRGGLVGRWIGTCRFTLDLPGFEAVTLEVGSLDVLPLPLRQLQQHADELAGFTRPLVRPESLAPGYEPREGDALRTHAGHVFRVLGLTSDGRAVELERLDGERRIFVPIEELSDYFVSLEPDLGG